MRNARLADTKALGKAEHDRGLGMSGSSERGDREELPRTAPAKIKDFAIQRRWKQALQLVHGM